MKKIITSCSLALLLISCGSDKPYTIEVHNQSAKRFDSVHVFIDTGPSGEPAVKYGPLGPGKVMPPLTIGELLGRGQPKMGSTAIFYAADTIIRYQGPYDEGLIQFNHYKISIDSGLQVRWAEWQ
jgi:hypothetical protein